MDLALPTCLLRFYKVTLGVLGLCTAEKSVIKPRRCQSCDTNAGFNCCCCRSDVHRAFSWEVFCVGLIERTLKVARQPRALTFKKGTDKLDPLLLDSVLTTSTHENISSICISKYPGALPLVFPSAGRSRVLLVRMNSL